MDTTLREACAPYRVTSTPGNAVRSGRIVARMVPEALLTRQALVGLRQRHKLPAPDLAAALGITEDRLCDWETGRTPISPEGRKLLWLVTGLLDGTAPRTLFELSTWNRYRKLVQKP